jgi:mono/diheme cytochrome c family protein
LNVIMRAWLVIVPGSAFALAFASAASVAQPATDPRRAAIGEGIYADYCWTCHGERLRNPGGGTSFDLRQLRPDDYARFVSAVLNGKNQMPPWRGVLDAEQIDSLWAYIRANVDR